jgi:hypothetical protein
MAEQDGVALPDFMLIQIRLRDSIPGAWREIKVVPVMTCTGHLGKSTRIDPIKVEQTACRNCMGWWLDDWEVRRDNLDTVALTMMLHRDM